LLADGSVDARDGLESLARRPTLRATNPSAQAASADTIADTIRMCTDLAPGLMPVARLLEQSLADSDTSLIAEFLHYKAA
jgi:hypothetical protein